MNLKIAVCGNVGSGKTAVIDYLKTKGFNCFSCDEAYKNIFLKKNEIYEKIIEQFNVLNDRQEVNFKKLAKLVFNDQEKLKKINAITHPYIKKQMLNFIEINEIAICEVPLLFEVAWEDEFDYIICVTLDEKIRIKRLIKRGLSLNQINDILKNQIPESFKIKHSDFIIYNNDNLEKLYRNIDEILIKLDLC